MTEIKFNAAAAEKLVREMEAYCQSMSREGGELLDLLENANEWNDSQSQIFTEDLMEISKMLVEALGNYSTYMDIFSKRIAELRG